MWLNELWFCETMIIRRFSHYCKSPLPKLPLLLGTVICPMKDLPPAKAAMLKHSEDYAIMLKS